MPAGDLKLVSYLDVVLGIEVAGDEFGGAGFGAVGFILESPNVVLERGDLGVGAGSGLGKGAGEDFDGEFERRLGVHYNPTRPGEPGHPPQTWGGCFVKTLVAVLRVSLVVIASPPDPVNRATLPSPGLRRDDGEGVL